MNNSEEIINLLREIKSNLNYILGSLPDVGNIEDLLEKILEELKKK